MKIFRDIIGTGRMYILMLGFMALLWGLWILAPWTVWIDVTSYRFIGALGGEVIWGIIFTIAGGLKIWATYVHNVRGLSISALIEFYLWLLIAVGIVTSNWRSPAVVVYGVLALMNALIYVVYKRGREHGRFNLP